MEVTHAAVARKEVLRVSEGEEEGRCQSNSHAAPTLSKRPAVEGCGVALCLPLVDKEETSPRCGQVLGVVECSCAVPGAYSNADMHFACALVDTAAQTISRILRQVQYNTKRLVRAMTKQSPRAKRLSEAQSPGTGNSTENTYSPCKLSSTVGANPPVHKITALCDSTESNHPDATATLSPISLRHHCPVPPTIPPNTSISPHTASLNPTNSAELPASLDGTNNKLFEEHSPMLTQHEPAGAESTSKQGRHRDISSKRGITIVASNGAGAHEMPCLLLSSPLRQKVSLKQVHAHRMHRRLFQPTTNHKPSRTISPYSTTFLSTPTSATRSPAGLVLTSEHLSAMFKKDKASPKRYPHYRARQFDKPSRVQTNLEQAMQLYTQSPRPTSEGEGRALGSHGTKESPSRRRHQRTYNIRDVTRSQQPRLNESLATDNLLQTDLRDIFLPNNPLQSTMPPNAEHVNTTSSRRRVGSESEWSASLASKGKTSDRGDETAAAVSIQKHIRGHIARAEYRSQKLLRQHAATKIQSSFRMKQSAAAAKLLRQRVELICRYDSLFEIQQQIRMLPPAQLLAVCEPTYKPTEPEQLIASGVCMLLQTTPGWEYFLQLINKPEFKQHMLQISPMNPPKGCKEILQHIVEANVLHNCQQWESAKVMKLLAEWMARLYERIANKDCQDVQAAAASIQARYRGYRVRRDLETIKTRQHYRKRLARQRSQRKQTKAAVKLQAATRGFSSRKWFAATKQAQTDAAIRIQSCTRGYLQRKKTQSLRQQLLTMKDKLSIARHFVTCLTVYDINRFVNVKQVKPERALIAGGICICLGVPAKWSTAVKELSSANAVHRIAQLHPPSSESRDGKVFIKLGMHQLIMDLAAQIDSITPKKQNRTEVILANLLHQLALLGQPHD